MPYRLGLGGYNLGLGGYRLSPEGGVDRLVADNFEDANLAEWRLVDAGDWGFVSSPVWEGANALSLIDGKFDEIYTIPGDGLANYYSKGDGELYFYIRANALDGVPWVRFGLTDNSNNYFVEVNFEAGDFDLLKETTGSAAFVSGNSSVTYTVNTWYEVKITWDDGTLGGVNNDITAVLTENPAGAATVLSTNSGNDSTHAGSGFGVVNQSIGGSTGNRVYLDYLSIIPA